MKIEKGIKGKSLFGLQTGSSHLAEVGMSELTTVLKEKCYHFETYQMIFRDTILVKQLHFIHVYGFLTFSIYSKRVAACGSGFFLEGWG